MDLLFIFSCGCIAERLFLLLFCELTTLHKKHQRAAMDSLRSALSIVPSGTAATIIVGHALLTKVRSVWKPASELDAIKQMQLRGRRRVDGVGASEI